MSKFSATRIADEISAVSSNIYLQPAIGWLRSHTDMGRFSDLEIYEILYVASTSNGGPFTFTYNTHSVP